MQALTKKTIQQIFKPRKAASHKGDHGHAFLIAGSKGRMGAAVIAARACLRSGAGLLTVNVPGEERSILQIAAPEAMLTMREENININKFSAVGIGPATGTDGHAAIFLSEIISAAKVPLLLDADALTLLSLHTDIFEKLPARTVLTPHPKEFDRLFGEHENDEARRKTAVEKAAEKNIVIVLKGHRTFITAEGRSFLNSTGNAGLAKSGSGDALTGIITAFLAQDYEPFDAARLGVYIHGLAADIALKKQSTESMLVTDVIECIGKAFKHILRN